MSWTWFNIKELAIALQKSDVKGVTTGPEYYAKLNWDGAKKLGVNLNQDQITGTGNGLPIDTQTAQGTVEIAVETIVMTPEVEAVLYGQGHVEDPDKSRLVYHEDSVGNYVGLWARTDKVGTNGEDVVLWIPRAQFASNNKDASENAHRNLTYNGAASYTKSSIQFEELNRTTGLLETITKRFLMVEDNNRVAASLFSPNSGYLVPTTTDITGHSVSANINIDFPRSLKRASINKSTVLFKQSATPVAFALSIADNSGTDNRIIINPNSNLSAATTYTVTLKTAIQDVDGNHIETDTEIDVTTA